MSTDAVSLITSFALEKLKLDGAKLSDEYFYYSLPLCVIDAVYSIGVKYEATRQVVIRYCGFTGQARIRPSSDYPQPEQQESLTQFCGRFKGADPSHTATRIFRNSQRTSPKSGILKAEAVQRFAETLCIHGINYFQDLAGVVNWGPIEAGIRQIPGQGSGISLQYFHMLAGRDDLIKPDRMILRFLKEVLGRDVTTAEAQSLLYDTSINLRSAHPGMTARLLDYVIWEHQRNTAAPETLYLPDKGF